MVTIFVTRGNGENREILVTKFDAKQLIERLKEHYRIGEDSELATFLGVHKQKVYGWKKRNTTDLEVILAKCRDVDLNWLFRGVALNDKAREELEALKVRIEALEKRGKSKA
jgi:hypothetical protein